MRVQTLRPMAPSPEALTITPLRGRAGLALAGEADFTAAAALGAALAALEADGAGQIHLDLARLRFIDVACTRELITFAGRHRAARLIICHPPAALVRITALAFPAARIEFDPPPGPLARPGPGQDAAARGDGRGSSHDGSRTAGPQRPPALMPAD